MTFLTAPACEASGGGVRPVPIVEVEELRQRGQAETAGWSLGDRLRHQVHRGGAGGGAVAAQERALQAVKRTTIIRGEPSATSSITLTMNTVVQVLGHPLAATAFPGAAVRTAV